MISSRRRKFTLIGLLLYWPAIFIFAHIPIPQVVRRAGVSDKSLHFLAYFVLTCLLWLAVSPNKKVNWRKAAVWWILVVVVWYGVIDELLQARVGRSCDLADFIADIIGTFSGLVLVSVFSFWPAVVAVTAVAIFIMSSLAKANLFELMPVTNVILHLAGYAFFTLVWLRYLRNSFGLKLPALKPLVAGLAGPFALLIVVRIFCLIVARPFDTRGIIVALVSILSTAGVVFVLEKHKIKKQLKK